MSFLPQVSTVVHADAAAHQRDIRYLDIGTRAALPKDMNIYKGAEVMVFTNGTRGYMCLAGDVMSNGYVTLMPCSHTIPSLTVKADAIKYGAKLAQVHAGLGKVIHYYRGATRTVAS